MPLFSIIIPVYNVQNYLSACVKSVVEQPGPRDWECILVDDGSTDQSGAMCDALAAELPGLQVIHRENGGLAAARNTGLKAATGDWLLFLDSDDAMAPGLLAQLRGALAVHPDCDWFIGKHLEWQPDGTLTPHDGLHLVPGPFASSDYAARLKALYTAGHWSVWKYCIRRSFLEQARVRFLPDCVWAEDWPFDLELLLHCDRLYFLDTVFTHYRVGRQGSLLTDAKNLPKRFRGLAAAQRRLARLSANGTADAAAYAAMQDAAADVFWPQARTAAVKDAAIRKACLPYIEQLRPLYPHGTEARGAAPHLLFIIFYLLFKNGDLTLRTKRTLLNMAYALGSSLLLLLLGLVTRRLLVDNFGPQITTASQVVSQLFTFFSIAEFGVGSVISYRLYEQQAHVDVQVGLPRRRPGHCGAGAHRRGGPAVDHA